MKVKVFIRLYAFHLDVPGSICASNPIPYGPQALLNVIIEAMEQASIVSILTQAPPLPKLNFLDLVVVWEVVDTKIRKSLLY